MSIPEWPYQPIHATYASHLSGEAVDLGLTRSDDFWMLFTLCSLYFDSVALSGASLVSHSGLYKRWLTDPRGMQAVYESVLEPVIGSDHDSMLAVAEQMVRDSSVHDLPSADELVRHAHAFAGPAVRLRHFSNADVRAGYYSTMVELSRCINVDGLQGRGDLQVPPGLLSGLVHWLETSANRHDLRCSDIYRFAESNWGGPVRLVKILGEVSLQHAMASTQASALSVASGGIAVVDAIEALSCPGISKSVVCAARDGIVVRVPHEAISSLPADHLLAIRETPQIVELRRRLSLFRAGAAQWDVVELQRLADEAANAITEFAVSDMSKARRDRVLRGLREERPSFLRLVVNRLTHVPTALVLFLPESVDPLAKFAMSVGLGAMGRQLASCTGAGAHGWRQSAVYPHPGALELSPVDGSLLRR